jgi:hypothetical protein
VSPSIRTPGPGDPAPSRALTPPSRPESNGSYDRLEEKLTALAATMSRWQRDLDSATNRATRLEGAFSVLLSSLEGWKSDIREVAGRTEARVLRGLEVIDARITKTVPAKVEPDTRKLDEAVQALHGTIAKLQELPHAGTRLENRILETLEEIKSAPSDAEAEGKTVGSALTVMLESLEAVKDERHQAVQEIQASLIKGLESLEKAFTERMAALSAELGSQQESRNWARLGEGLSILDRRLQAIEEKVSATTDDPPAAAHLEGLTALERRLHGIETRLAAPPSPEVPPRLVEGLSILDRRMQSIEERLSAPAEAEMPARLGQALSTLESRLAAGQENLKEALAQAAASQNLDAVAGTVRSLEARISETQELVARKLDAARTDADSTTAAQIRYLTALEEAQANVARRIQGLEAKVPAPIDLAQLEALARGQERIQEAVARTRNAENWDQLTKSLQRLEARLADSQEAFGRKLESVQAGSDENNATQLRYLAGLEELQATLVNRMKILEATLSNPLDAQQWERLAKGLEFLDSRLAQSYDSVANRLDTAISALTNTLDNRTAAGQEANLKSAERIWRALAGLEDKVAGSSQATRQSQERIEKATSNLAGALEELRAITGARAGHTEKLLMEALENLDGRFSQNLMAVSESLSSAIFALNKATGEWRSELFNASEESEERVVKEINDAEAKLAGSLKSGLEALGRREERILALILGGGAAFSPASEELPDSPD